MKIESSELIAKALKIAAARAAFLIADSKPAHEPRHGFAIVAGRASGPLCGAAHFEGYASSIAANVRCRACLELLATVIVPAPVAKSEPAPKRKKTTEPKPQTGFEF